MAHLLADRVKETTTTTGTGTLALAGAVAQFRAFGAVLANNDTTLYAIVGQTGTEWEVGVGTWTTGNNLARTTILASSNAGSVVTLSAGTKDVFITLTPAGQMPRLLLAPGVAAAGGAPLTLASGPLLSTAIAGAFEYETQIPYFTPQDTDRGIVPAMMMRMLATAQTGADSSAAQPWIPTNGGVTLRASTSYRFTAAFRSVRSAGATSHTTTISFLGTATFNDFAIWVQVKEGDTNGLADSDLVYFPSGTAINSKAGSTSTTENQIWIAEGVLNVDAAGTFIPSFTYSAAPGGAPSISVGTFMAFYPIGTGTADVTLGTWA